jgi:superfamily II DNA or RNA helicase
VLRRSGQLFDAARAGYCPWARLDQSAPWIRCGAQTRPRTAHRRRVWPSSPRCATASAGRPCRRLPQGCGRQGPDAKLLKVKLYPYQAEGALFAARAGACLLGDEMGLGKTVQAIAAAELLARHFGVQRVLVVCPTSLKHQWKASSRALPGRPGAGHPRPARAAPGSSTAKTSFCRITNYETLVRDADLIDAWAPELVIADEAQRIKNWNTVAARALKRIASPYAIVLTGTPLENRWKN